MIKLAVVQAPAAADPGENLDTLRRFAAQARDLGCEALCFPEASLTGYLPERAGELALSREDPLLDQVARAAGELGIDILTGFMEDRGGKYHLSQGIFLKGGERHFYRKTHLGRRERSFFSPGDRLEAFTLSCGLRIGIQLCVETHFPEISQTLSLKGAELIFAPHAAPRASGDRLELWRRYIPARSYDNRVYMACCCQWDGERFPGGCLVTGPRGEELASFSEDRAGILCFQVDREEIASYHRDEPSPRYRYFPSSRRPELYE